MTEARAPAGAAPPSLADPIGTRTRIARADTERLGALREGVMAGQAQQLRLNLFRDVEYRATLEQSTPTASGYTLSGPLDGVPFGRVVLVVNDGKTYGRVYAPEGNWTIRTVGEMQTVERLAPEPLRCGLETGTRTDRETRIGTEEVDRVQIGRGWEERGDHGAMTPETRGLARFGTWPRDAGSGTEARQRIPMSAARAPPLGVGAGQGNGATVDVLVVYPSFVRDFEGGYGPMLSLIDLDMATANEAYAASGVELRVELAAAVEVEYDWFLDASLVSHTHFETALGHLANPEDGYLDEIHDLRERYAADMVLLHLGGQITSLVATTQPLPGTTVGIAFAVHDVSTKVLKRVALAIARSGDGTAVAHELGHGMGLHHERSKEEPSFNKPFPYSHGFAYDHAAPIPDKPGETYPVVRFGTIMSRYSDRAYPGFVLAFSNPDLVHPEDPELRLGVPGDEPSSDVDGPADATRHLNEVRAVLANVRVRAEADSCRYEVTGESGDLPAGGGTYRVRVETEPDCAWTARGGEWVSSVSSRAGTGSADIGYTVGTNEGFGRPVEILVAGHVHARTQAGSRSITPVCERSNSIKWDLVKMHPDYRLETEGFGNVVVVTYETSCHELTFDPDFLASIDTFNPNAGDPRYIWRGYKVREVRPGDFDGLTGLSTLRVNGFEELPPDAFAGLAGLRILDLSQELFDDSAKLRSIASGAFRGLPGLRRLQIDGHRLRRLDAGAFEGSTGLVHLRVSGARAGALTLEAGAFEGLDDLRLLDVAGNGMTELPPNLFGGLTELRSLILWRNRLKALPDFDGLSALLLLDLWSNEFEAFPSGAFDGLSGLKELNLSFNRLDDVPAAALSSLAALEALDLGRNRLAALEPGDFRDLSELRWLSLDSNRITRLEPGTFDGLSKLFALGMDKNGLGDVAPGAFEGLGSLEELYLPENPLGVLRNGVFDGLDNLRGLSLYRSGVKAFEAGLFEATPRLHEVIATASTIRRLGFGALVGLGHVGVAHFYANPGTPFAVAPTPVLVGAGNGVRRQPLEIALEIASAAPFGARASIVASGGSVSRDALTVGPGRIRSSGNATVTPDGDGPVTVRIAAEPDLVAGASDWRCEPRIGASLRACFLGFRLAAGPPLVLYGIEDRSLLRGREAEEIDLAEVFSYFVGAASYTVSTSDDAVAAVRVADGTLTVTPGATGTAEVTVTAEGAGGETLTRRFAVTVGVPSIPLLLSASEPGREGFVRILNHSDRAGTVRITAIDDAGTRRGPVRLRLRPYGAAQFNSTDLREGNETKRLLDGVGVGHVEGDWRLEFESDLDIEALSYARTEDGFVAPIHDAAPFEDGVHRIATFNPASDVRQSSRLRVINTGREAAEVTVRGVDDAGESPAGAVRFSIPAGTAREFDAMQLEAGDADLDGALGDGEGKWRLSVAADAPVVAMSLLENASTGHLTNLSSAPAPPGEDGIHHVAVFPAAGDAPGGRGFARVINRSRKAGVVRIDAFDDAGVAYGPLELSVAAGAVAHFNSDDLELGAPGKGLTGSTGMGAGDWRLELSSDLDIQALAYVRAEDGFLTTTHDVVAVRDGRREVVLFNPASNASQISRLRFSNPHPENSFVRILGTDDLGALPGALPRGGPHVYVPARGAVTLSAAELEAGVPHPRFDGYWSREPLGDGRGKWRLSVVAEPGVLVQSLLENPTGHLTNLSSAPRMGAH